MINLIFKSFNNVTSLKFRDCTFQVYETVSVIWNNRKAGKVTLLRISLRAVHLADTNLFSDLPVYRVSDGGNLKKQPGTTRVFFLFGDIKLLTAIFKNV